MALTLKSYELQLIVNKDTGVVEKVYANPIKGSTDLPDSFEPDPAEHSPGAHQSNLDAFALACLNADKTRLGV